MSRRPRNLALFVFPTHAEIDAHIKYDPDTGKMWFKRSRGANKVLQYAGGRVRGPHVWCVGRRLDVSDVAYVLGSGEELEQRNVLHLDGKRTNLKFENLVATDMTPKEVEEVEREARIKPHGYQPDSKTAPIPLPPLSQLRRLFDCDFERGYLMWKKDNVSRYGLRLAGDIVGTPDRKGFLKVNLRGQGFSVHRIIWKLASSQDPGRRDVVHINGDPTDNRISNLAAGRLTFKPTKHTRFDPTRGQWLARLRFGGVTSDLGWFETGELAAEAVKAARSALEAEFGTV